MNNEAPIFPTPRQHAAPPPPSSSSYYGDPSHPRQPIPVNGPVNGFAIAGMVLGILWLYWLGSILRVQRARAMGSEGGGLDDLIAGVRKLVSASGCESRPGSRQGAW